MKDLYLFASLLKPLEHLIKENLTEPRLQLLSCKRATNKTSNTELHYTGKGTLSKRGEIKLITELPTISSQVFNSNSQEILSYDTSWYLQIKASVNYKAGLTNGKKKHFGSYTALVMTMPLI